MDALLSFIPILLVAALCPLMMILMMRGMHGGHRADNDHSTRHGAGQDAEEIARLRAEVAELREQVDNPEPDAAVSGSRRAGL